ncbi:O-antigen translocase [Thermomonas sp.]|uniref:O-antigen translocase n=1 Tax=Thermomonas sp. TaxID=1971895 RepID=UPI001AC1EAB8|nr:O-antigen translocase [Xanthomonadales bacterium]MBN8794114.1 O-antigen translocase [Stenotrophomonas nitritireducens]
MSNSYRQILRSSSIIGGASVINIAVGLLRMKAAALLLGPAGVGLIGLLQNMLGTAAGIAGLGVGNVGTRQIAEASASGDRQAVAATRRALFWLTLALAVLGALLFWLLRDELAVRVLGVGARGREVGWLALGVGLTVAAASQSALLNGMRRIADLARISIGSALLSTLAAVAAIWHWGERGILVFVLAAPAASFLLGHWYVAKLGRLHAPRSPLPALMAQWRAMLRLGAAFMFSGLMVNLGQLLVRTLIQREAGAEALGHFQAAWLISMTYLGFVLGAMGTDYYPRLTAAIRDPQAVNRLVNEQTEVALLLAGPAFLAMLALAPWIIGLLYSREFSEAVGILRWQVLGDVLKVAAWPLGFVILAAGDGRTFMLTESLAIGVFGLLVAWGLPVFGVMSAGLAFLAMNAFLLPLVHWLARRRTGFRWQAGVRRRLGMLLAASALVAAAGGWQPLVGAAVGVPVALAVGMHGLARLGHMAGLGGPVGRLAGFSRKVMMRIGVWRE